MSEVDVLEQMRSVDHAKILFLDLNGRVMSLPVNAADIEALAERGVGFDGSSIAGISTVDDSDRILRPALSSFRNLELGGESLGVFAGTIHDAAGARSSGDCRAVLERQVERARKAHGLRFLVGPEHEYFLLRGTDFGGDIHTDAAGYFVADPVDRGEGVRREIVRVLERSGVVFEKAHHEVTASQHEINLQCAEPLEAADRTVVFNYVTQRVAAEHGLYATFLPKPFDGQNRNAFHIHVSAQYESGENAFYDPDDQQHLSHLARHFIGGIVAYGRQTSIVMASTSNSYKAYVAEREAPIVRGWGLRNRSSMVRIPHAFSPHATRLELRNPDPSGNVYLQMAAILAMGLKGIEEEADCGAPDLGSTYRREDPAQARLWDERYLPRCMFEALVEAERSDFLCETLGERLYARFLALKSADWEEHRTTVTAREYARYLRC